MAQALGELIHHVLLEKIQKLGPATLLFRHGSSRVSVLLLWLGSVTPAASGRIAATERPPHPEASAHCTTVAAAGFSCNVKELDKSVLR